LNTEDPKQLLEFWANHLRLVAHNTPSADGFTTLGVTLGVAIIGAAKMISNAVIESQRPPTRHFDHTTPMVKPQPPSCPHKNTLRDRNPGGGYVSVCRDCGERFSR
jgi:hypothetical protein